MMRLSWSNDHVEPSAKAERYMWSRHTPAVSLMFYVVINKTLSAAIPHGRARIYVVMTKR